MKLFFLFLALSFSTMALGKEIYKWTDENGKTHFSDKKPGNIVIEKSLTAPNQPETKVDLQRILGRALTNQKGKYIRSTIKHQK